MLVQRHALRHDVDVRFCQSVGGLTNSKTNTKPWFVDDCKGVPRHIDPTTFGAETLRPGPLSQGKERINQGVQLGISHAAGLKPGEF